MNHYKKGQAPKPKIVSGGTTVKIPVHKPKLGNKGARN